MMPTPSVANWLVAIPMLLTLGIVLYGIRAFGWLKTLKITNGLLVDQNEALRTGNTDLLAHNALLLEQNKCDNRERDARIDTLVERVHVLETVPLQEISATLKEMLRQSQRVEAALGLSNASTLAGRQLVADKLVEHDAAATQH